MVVTLTSSCFQRPVRMASLEGGVAEETHIFGFQSTNITPCLKVANANLGPEDQKEKL